MNKLESPDLKNKKRFLFIDQFRGLIGIMMLLGHSSYFFNSVWKHLDPLDPFFSSFGQFALRYMGYLCAPGFLMMNGAMVWYAYTKRVDAGKPEWNAKWHMIQRGLFLILVQITWVNSSWGGFTQFKPGHLGIIATIGISMCILALIVNTPWRFRLGIALALFFVHPFLLNISYDPGSWTRFPMQIFIDSGEFNKYPVIPWLGLAIMGSVMANGWLQSWRTTQKRVLMSLLISAGAIALGIAVRMGGGYGNIFPFSNFGHYSFFLDQKYPPSLYHAVTFFGAVTGGVAIIQLVGHFIPRLTAPLGIVGRVPLFFYCVHIGILGIVSKRIGIYYREGGVAASLIGLAIMLVVMMPLASWFGRVKQRSRNYLIRMI